VLAIYGAQPFKERRSTPCSCPARCADHHLTARNDRLLVGNRDGGTSIKGRDRGMDTNESRCSGNNDVWRCIKNCVTQLLPAQPNVEPCARMGGGKPARRITLTTNGECDELKALSIVTEHLERLRAN
jgi:hypothetical protein